MLKVCYLCHQILLYIRFNSTIYLDGINKLAKVVHNSNGTVTCFFLYHSSNNKTCDITYFTSGCQQALLQIGGETDNNLITLQLSPGLELGQYYCFIATVSNGSTTMKIKGSYFHMYRQQGTCK